MRRRGFLLLMSLLLMAIIAVLGVGFATSRQRRYSAAARAVALAQAKALAQAGMEDARLKIERDVAFPPQVSLDQTSYSYVENVTAGTTTLGHYVVTVNTAFAVPPCYTLRVQSEGMVGDSNKPSATFTIAAEFDISPANAYNTTVGTYAGNGRIGNQYRIVNWNEDVNAPCP